MRRKVYFYALWRKHRTSEHENRGNCFQHSKALVSTESVTLGKEKP
ncbi:MAG: hypothetical protein IJG23_03955 [Clostridia bacterium]|nr:hypothetical protein [Clostridia bacterium]